MLSGIKYPQNLRAMHLLVEEVLRSVIAEADFSSVIMVINIMTELDKCTSCSRAVKLWRDNLIKPVVIMMVFSREVTGFCSCLLQKKCYHAFMLLVARTTLDTASLMLITGAVGLATDWNQMATWALSFATCAHDVTKTYDGQREVIHTHHKEESQVLIQNDNNDRCIIRSNLTMCIDQLNDASHPDGALITGAKLD